MEFERSIFRIHEKLLHGRTAKTIVHMLYTFTFFSTVLTFLRFVHYHKSYVNDGSILQNEIEQQLLNNTKIYYSPTDGSFVFYNTTVKNQTQLEGIDTKLQNERENGFLKKDDLFFIVVLRNEGIANNLKKLPTEQKLNYYKSSQTIQSDVYAEYWYSSELSIFNMRNNKIKYEHNVNQHVVILSLDDITTNFFVRFQFGWGLDFDVIMINQILFTFKRQVGFTNRNDTGESWYWDQSDYHKYLPNAKYDFNDHFISWLSYLIFRKILIFINAYIGFTFLSLINALLIRVAILCSSIAIFPLLSCARSILRSQLNRFQVAAIYRASPHIGAQAAYLDRRGSPKLDLICAYIFCLLTFYFMYASCYLIWTSIIFPGIMAKGINDLYFFYVNLMEFVSLFFIRTRTSIKYFSKLITILNICFIMYLNQYLYCSQYEAFSFLCQISACLAFAFMHFVEQPALNDWNPFGTYTPNINNPRSGYQIVPQDQFLMGFNVFTMFQGLRFRDTFTQEEQRTYDLLSQQDILGYDFDPEGQNQQRNDAQQQQQPQQQQQQRQRQQPQAQQLNIEMSDLGRRDVVQQVNQDLEESAQRNNSGDNTDQEILGINYQFH